MGPLTAGTPIGVMIDSGPTGISDASCQQEGPIQIWGYECSMRTLSV